MLCKSEPVAHNCGILDQQAKVKRIIQAVHCNNTLPLIITSIEEEENNGKVTDGCGRTVWDLDLCDREHRLRFRHNVNTKRAPQRSERTTLPAFHNMLALINHDTTYNYSITL